MNHGPDDQTLRIRGCSLSLGDRLANALGDALMECPDLAFCHLAEVQVEGHGAPAPTLFVWLEGRALSSIRSALGLVSKIVAGCLPQDQFVDVVILNSAPELLSEVVAHGRLVATQNPEELDRAIHAARAPVGTATDAGELQTKSWWRQLLGW